MARMRVTIARKQFSHRVAEIQKRTNTIFSLGHSERLFQRQHSMNAVALRLPGKREQCQYLYT